MSEKALFAEAFIYQPSIVKRLASGFAEASNEFRQNPKAFVATAIKGDGVGGRTRQDRLMLGFAVAMFVFASVVATMLFAYWLKHRGDGAPQADVEVAQLIDVPPQDLDMPKMEKKAGGGGGGGRQAPTPASKGQLPKFSLTPPIIAPRPEPQLKPPALPVMETVQVDPRLEPPRLPDVPTGDPKGVPGPPSPGPGTGGGIGSGDQGGIGSGHGTGVGPGNGYNMGGGNPNIGGGDRNAPATAVDQKPVPLNAPSPRYTEEARKNKIQGVVLARVLVGPDGSVKQARVTRGLPDGLDEQAIQAAYQLRFRPAMKGGSPVAFWVTVQIEFNLR